MPPQFGSSFPASLVRDAVCGCINRLAVSFQPPALPSKAWASRNSC
jgi:hypothetical protein